LGRGRVTSSTTGVSDVLATGQNVGDGSQLKLRRRFEPQGDGLNAQLGRTFTHKKKMKKPDLPGWSHPGDMVRIHENIFDPENLASTIWFQVEW